MLYADWGLAYRCRDGWALGAVRILIPMKVRDPDCVKAGEQNNVP